MWQQACRLGGPESRSETPQPTACEETLTPLLSSGYKSRCAVWKGDGHSRVAGNHHSVKNVVVILGTERSATGIPSPDVLDGVRGAGHGE